MTFKDHFSNNSQHYAASRPTYPMALYEYLADLTKDHQLAWDCGTGNGQAAIGLAALFDQVIATDASKEQIAHAIPHERITYRIALAEKSGLPDEATDLVAVGTALHWFKLEDFFEEVKRVLKPGGILAAWGYGFISDPPAVAKLFNDFAGQTLKNYWPGEAYMNWKDQYRSIELPFPRVDAPTFHASMDWDLPSLKDFILSWSSINQYKKEHGKLPTEEVFSQLDAIWGDPEQIRTIEWPLHMVIGRKPE